MLTDLANMLCALVQEERSSLQPQIQWSQRLLGAVCNCIT